VVADQEVLLEDLVAYLLSVEDLHFLYQLMVVVVEHLQAVGVAQVALVVTQALMDLVHKVQVAVVMVVLLFTALVEQVVQVVVVAMVQDQQDHVDQAEVEAELKTAHVVDTQEALVVLAT
jgi:Na+/melibiose symporter-like transporter